MIETPAHSCRFAQSYSSWSCSPAELHYASDCGTKVQTIIQIAKKSTLKGGLQFELLVTYYSKTACNLSYTPKYITHIMKKENVKPNALLNYIKLSSILEFCS